MPGEVSARCARKRLFCKSDGDHGSNGPKVSDSGKADATSVKEIGSGCVGVANGSSCGTDAGDSKVTMPIVPVKGHLGI